MPNLCVLLYTQNFRMTIELLELPVGFQTFHGVAYFVRAKQIIAHGGDIFLGLRSLASRFGEVEILCGGLVVFPSVEDAVLCICFTTLTVIPREDDHIWI